MCLASKLVYIKFYGSETYSSNKSPVGNRPPKMSCFWTNRTIQECSEGRSHILSLLLKYPCNSSLRIGQTKQHKHIDKQVRMSSKTGMKKLRNCLETISENRLFKKIKIKIKNNFLTQKGVYVLTEKSFFKIVLKTNCFLEQIYTHTQLTSNLE